MVERAVSREVPNTPTPDAIRAQRASNQRLIGANVKHDLPRLLRDICGVQAQYPAAAELALRARSPGLTVATVRDALSSARSMVRTWCMRGTLHWLAAADVNWLVALHGPHFIKTSARRYEQLGLTARRLEKASEQLQELLSSGHAFTRAEIVDALASEGTKLAGQAGYHLIRRAALGGSVCFGPDRGKEPTYVATETWLGQEPPWTQDRALAELARRYFATFGPATVADLAAWSGLPLVEMRRAQALARADLVEGPGEFISARAPIGSKASLKQQHWLRLLPAYDPYWLGYRHRSLLIAPNFLRRVHPGGGLLRAVLTIDGVTTGTWALQRKKGALVVQASGFRKLTGEECAALAEEVSDIGRFLGELVDWEVC